MQCNLCSAAVVHEARQRKKKSRWGGSENDKTFIPGMPTILPATLDPTQQEAYLGNYKHFNNNSRRARTQPNTIYNYIYENRKASYYLFEHISITKQKFQIYFIF